MVRKVQGTKLRRYKKNGTKSAQYEAHSKKSPETPHNNRGDTRSRNLYQKLAPNRGAFCSVQVYGRSFLIVCHLYESLMQHQSIVFWKDMGACG